jgi:tetratricopeptide (TPR) repeat protein
MRTIALIAGVLALAIARPAAAQSDNKALAEQLFTQGKDLAKAGDWAAACPKFEASLRYDPALGTRLNLATCYEKVGKLASAWALYKESVDLARKAGDDKRRTFAAKQVSALEPRLPRLTIVAPAAAPSGLVVTRGGTTVDAALFGAPTFVDPGEHEIVASAPGYEPWTGTIVVAEGKAQTITIPDLTLAKPEPDGDKDLVEPDLPPDGDGPDGPDGPGPMPGPEGRGGGSRKLIGLATAGGGLLLIGAGLYFGNSASGSYADAKDACGGDLICDNADDLARSEALVDDARSAATKSTILTGVGAAALVGGVILWLTAPSGDEPRDATAWRISPAVGPDRATLVLGGSF